MKLVSACLAGIKCRYDGRCNTNETVVDLVRKEEAVLICPEQMGGLSTPRTPAERIGDKIITKDGEDVTYQFHKGAEDVLYTAQLVKATEAILKSKSPSCGCGQIYDGTFTKTLTERDGVTTELLKKHGIKVITEEEL